MDGKRDRGSEMTTLSREHRRLLESTIRKARKIAEVGAKAALEQLAVDHHEPRGNLTPEQRKLRNDLRAHGRQIGDPSRDGSLGTLRVKGAPVNQHQAKH